MEKRSRQEIADQLREECFTTKGDILEWLEKARIRIKRKSESDIKHSAAFYHVYDRLLVSFIEKISQTILFEQLEDFWHYAIALSDEGAVLYLEHYTYQYHGETINYMSDQSFVTAGTVRQWIRRGKIRNAMKVGSEWRIPELTELPTRGYSAGVYMWHERLKNLPEEYEFLNNYAAVLINQDQVDKNYFNISFVARGVDTKEMRVDVKEREKIELFLISHPQIHFNGGPDDGLNLHISRKCETGFFYDTEAEEMD